MTVLIGEKKIRIPTKKLLTYDDYAKLTPPDSGNYELHNGQIVYIPTPIPRHQDISGRLHYMLFGFILTHNLGKLFAAPMDVKFTKNDTVQPDLLFISNANLGIIGEKKIEGVPDFIVEIHSPGNSGKEMSFKKYLYESTGVKEYWVIYPTKNTIKQYQNKEEDFVLMGEFGIEETIKSIVLEGFSLKISDILS
jgi:Uma2 family endonuclease